MSEYQVQVKPNWRPDLNPTWHDLSGRILIGGGLMVSEGIERREDPTLLTYDDVTLQFNNSDGALDDLFSLANIVGTDPTTARAPLLHMGLVKFFRREDARSDWEVLLVGLIDPTQVRYNPAVGVLMVTVFSIAKLLEHGNAERAHRFAYIYPGGLPQPYVLTGYDLGHPAAPPGNQTLTPSVPGNPIPLVGTSPTGAPWPANQIRGNLTLFTRDLRVGNTITINGVSATILTVDNDGQITLSSNWGGVDTAGAFTAFMYFSGQSDSVFRLSRDVVHFPAGPEPATLQFYAGDKFKAVARVLPADYLEAMTLTELESTEIVVKSATPNGNDLLITSVDPVPGLSLYKGQASMQLLTPWFRGRQLIVLLQALVAEVNASTIAAGSSEVLQIALDSLSGALGTSFVDLIDLLNLTFPSTGIAWAGDAGGPTGRVLLQGSSGAGRRKPDILLDPASADRTFGNCAVSTGFNIGPGGPGGLVTRYTSPDLGKPNIYPNPALQFAGALPPPDRTVIPEIGPEFHAGASLSGKMTARWTLVPSSYAAVGTKSAYRLESNDVVAPITAGPLAGTTRNVIGYVLGLYTTVDNGHTWTLSSQSIQRENRDDPNGNSVLFNQFAQGALQLFPVGGGFLYLLTDGGRMKPLWFLGATDTQTPAAIVAGLVEFVDGATHATNASNRSGAVFDGVNVFYFEDQGAGQGAGPGTISMAGGSATVNGAGGSRFQRDLQPGDVLLDLANGAPAIQTITVLSIASDTVLTATAINGGGGVGADPYQIIKQASPPRFWWWNGAAMVLGTLVGFPNLAGADFAHAMVDRNRQHIYITADKTLYRIAYTFGAGTLTATNVLASPIDTQNYNPNVASDHVGALAWLAGPVDIQQGNPGELVDYQISGDAIIVGTTAANYIFSDAFGGVIQIADFTGLSCAEAIKLLAQFPYCVVTSGPDQEQVANPGDYYPQLIVRVRRRQNPAAPPRDLTLFAVNSATEPWIIQYTYVSARNTSANIPAGASDTPPKEVRNDGTFTFFGVTYTPTVVRYAGANPLQFDTPFVFTLSLLKVMANAYAQEMLIPRIGGKARVLNPHSVNGAAPLRALENARYLTRMPDIYRAAQSATGRIIRAKKHVDDNMVDLEIA